MIVQIKCLVHWASIFKESTERNNVFWIKWVLESFREKKELHFLSKAATFSVSESTFSAFNLYKDCVAGSRWVFAALVQRDCSALAAWGFPCNRKALTEIQWPAPSYFLFSSADMQNMELVHRSFLQVLGSTGILYRSYKQVCILQQCLWNSSSLDEFLPEKTEDGKQKVIVKELCFMKKLSYSWESTHASC